MFEPTCRECWHGKQTFSEPNFPFNLQIKPVTWKAEVSTQRLGQRWWACVCRHQTDESLARWLGSELTTL